MQTNPQNQMRSIMSRMEEKDKAGVPKEDFETARDIATDSIPGVSETKDIISLGSNIGKGDYVGAGIDATSLALGAVPVIGDAARQTFKRLAKNFVKTKKADVNVSAQDALKQTDKDIDTWKAKNQTSPEFQKRLKGRNETLQNMAQGLENKLVTKKEYREAVDAIRPIRTVKEVPKPASFKDTLSALDSRQRKNPIVGVNYNIPEGDKISARLDITAYTQYDTWIPTLKHEGKTMYKPSVVLKDVTFIKPDSPQVGKALKVATGKPKAPFAVMEGRYVDADNDSTYKYAKKIFKDKDVIQVGYDPTRRGYFYDRATGNPILEADEVVQVGHLVLAKKAKLGNADDFFYSKGGATMKKQMELFEGGDTSIDTSKLKSGVKEKKDARKIQFDNMTKMLTSGKVKDLSIEEKDKFVKLYKMLKQHYSFNDGGLLDEGGMIDEVSGNDVPTGSTREEVRDDIPAQLSEGEFVFPADVVRYIGLEKLMMMRQEAKQGLKQMEAMGQMGNSDEATMPDDLPFDETDLDIEDDLEYNVGGYVPAQRGMYVAPQVPMATGQPYTPNVGNVYTPTAQPYAPASYKQLLGTSAAGAPQTKNVRYFNQATGQTRMIPHILNPDGSIGNTLYPVPQGFIRQDVAPKEEAKTAVQSTKVAPVDAGDGGDEPSLTEQGYRENANVTFMGGKNVDGKRVGSRDIGVVTSIPGGIASIGGITGAIMAGITGNYPEGTKFGISLKGDPETIRYVTPERYKTLMEDPKKGDKFLDDMIKSKSIEDDVRSIARDTRIDEKLTEDEDFMKDISDIEKGISEESFKSTTPKVDTSDDDRGSYDPGTDSSLSDSSSSYDTSSFDNNDSGDSDSGYGDTSSDVGGWTAKGGLMDKKKIIMHKGAPKAKKRMKRGGLASKK